MAGPIDHRNGIGSTTGDDLLTLGHLLTTGDVWFVHYGNGTDAALVGKDRNRPLKTTAQAISNAAAGDVICWLDGHSETITSALTVNKARLKLCGEGSGTGRARFTRNANVVLFDITADDVMLAGIYCIASTTAATASLIKTASTGTVFRYSYVELGTSDDGPGFETVTGAARVRLKDVTFRSTATSYADQPHGAMKVTNALTGLHLDNVTLDGGSSGWAQPYAFNGNAAITGLEAYEVHLLNDSDVLLASGTSGYWSTGDTSGSARVVWTP